MVGGMHRWREVTPRLGTNFLLVRNLDIGHPVYYIMPKSPDLDFPPLDNHLHTWPTVNTISDLQEICAQSCGHIEAFRDIISPSSPFPES